MVYVGNPQIDMNELANRNTPFETMDQSSVCAPIECQGRGRAWLRCWHLVFCFLPSVCTFTEVKVLRCRRRLDTLKPMMELTSQLIGLIAGVIVFCCTVVVTFLLLVFGGSFKRMREQVTQQSSTKIAAQPAT